MAEGASNLNLRRELPQGLLARLAAPLLRPLLRIARGACDPGAPPTVYAAYMVGDLYMALPALKRLAAARPVRVLCRPDCASLLAREGLEAIPFPGSFRVRSGVGTFLRDWRAARALSGRLGPVALDLDADPRSALWLKLAGARRVVSYRRAHGVLFDAVFPLPEPSLHQADRDLRVVEEFLRSEGRSDLPPALRPSPHTPGSSLVEAGPWILSVWTRKPAKNWSLERWDAFLERALSAGLPCVVLEPPDGDAAFAAFRARWNSRVGFLSGSLPDIDEAARGCAGVVATDNFLGHMAGYHGKPVLWINRCSPDAQVRPRGPRTVAVPDAPRGGDPSVDAVWRAFETLRA